MCVIWGISILDHGGASPLLVSLGSSSLAQHPQEWLKEVWGQRGGMVPVEGREPPHLSKAPGSSFGPSQGRGDVQKGVAVEKGIMKAWGGVPGV